MVRYSGIGRYAKKAAESLLAHAPSVQLTLIGPEDDLLPFEKRARVLPSPSTAYGLKSFVGRDLMVDHVDVIHVPHWNVPIWHARKPLVVTIHDVITLRRDVAPAWKRQASLVGISRAMRRASVILAVSTFTKQTLVDELGCPPERIRVVYPAIWTNSRRVDRHTLPHAISVLTIGQRKKHKGLWTVAEAIRILKERGVRVLWTTVGPRDEYWSEIESFIEHHRLSSSVRVAWSMSDECLEREFSSCHCVVQASSVEGFGFVPLEAISRGVPVIASDIPVAREVLGPKWVRFPPGDADALACALLRLAESEERVPDEDVEEVRRRYGDVAFASALGRAYRDVADG